MGEPFNERRSVVLEGVLFAGPLATTACPPLATPFLATLSAILIGGAFRRGARWNDLLKPSHTIALSLLFASYIFVNATWSADPSLAVRRAAVFAIFVVLGFAATNAVAHFGDASFRRASLLFATGALLGAVFVLVELLTHGVITSTVMNHITILHPNNLKHLQIANDQIVSIDLDQFNHNVGVMTFNLWPGLLALSALKGSTRVAAMTVFFVAIAGIVGISDHNASQVALLGSAVVALTTMYWPRIIVPTLAVAWCAAFILVIPASFAAYQNGLHFATWLPGTARARVIIWEYTAEQVAKHPFLGVGVESTAVLNNLQKASGIPEQPEGFVFPRVLGSHAHNVYLQTWFELGALGAFLFAVAGAAVAVLILALPASVQPFAAGGFVTFAIVAAFSWGMWQMWFMSITALLPLCLRIAAASRDSLTKVSTKDLA